jgi:hypothetical protein
MHLFSLTHHAGVYAHLPGSAQYHILCLFYLRLPYCSFRCVGLNCYSLHLKLTPTGRFSRGGGTIDSAGMGSVVNPGQPLVDFGANAMLR